LPMCWPRWKSMGHLPGRRRRADGMGSNIPQGGCGQVVDREGAGALWTGCGARRRGVWKGRGRAEGLWKAGEKSEAVHM
jgi:hypothetical protein